MFHNVIYVNRFLDINIFIQNTKNIIENGKRVFQVIEELKENSYRCDSVVDDIYKDTKSNLISADDYIVLWDQEITFCKNSSYQHTIAEVLRIVLLTNEFQVPDRKIRSEVLAFYRAVLKISGRSIIGLSAGVLYVEHGTTSRPSLFYLGRDSILGKGCIIDGVGGSVILSESFIGGGFMPILIHTHKHIKIEKESAINERKNILSCLFFSSHGSRLPMSAVGLFESADYINKSSPYEGISIFSLCLEEEKSETLPCKN